VNGPAPGTKLPSGLAAIDSSLLDVTIVLTIRWADGSIQSVTSERAVPRISSVLDVKGGPFEFSFEGRCGFVASFDYRSD
jgi:hypothetical protein